MGNLATITVKNAIVTLDADTMLASISCQMTQDFTDGEAKQFVMDITFTYSNYGTTVIE
jgi:hypothetical protein